MAVDSSLTFHEIPDWLWERMDLFLPIYKPSRKGGRPRLPMRKVVEGILYVLSTGCQWKAMPKQFGSGSAIHAYYQEWVKRGVFQQLWEFALTEYDQLKGIDWKWQSMDGAMTKSPLGGEKNWQKSHRSGQTGSQTVHSDRWSRRAVGGRGGGCQRPRSETRGGDVGFHPDRTPRSHFGPTAESLSRQGICGKAC
jgi:transposase